MAKRVGVERVNIYLDSPDLGEKIKIAAARRGVTLSSYCLEAIRHRLAQEGYLTVPEASASARAAARGMDVLRRKVGPIGVPVSELVAERRRQ